MLETTSFIFSLTPDTASLITANLIENLEASTSSPKCIFTASKFSALSHAYSRNKQLFAFLVASLLYFTIDPVGNIEVYHKIIIFRGIECTCPWARLQGGQRAVRIRDPLVVTPKLAARFFPKWGKSSIRSKALNSTASYSTSAHFLASTAVMFLHCKVVINWSVNE